MRRLKIWEKLGIFVLVLIIVTVLIMNLFLEKEKQTSSAYQKILENVVLLNDATERLNEVLDELELYLSQSSTRNVDHLNAQPVCNRERNADRICHADGADGL